MLTGPEDKLTDEMIIAYMNNAPMRKKILENLTIEDQLELLSEAAPDVGTAIGASIGKVGTAAKKAAIQTWKAVKDAAKKAVKIIGHSILITIFPWMKPEYDRILAGGKTSNQLRDKLGQVYKEYITGPLGGYGGAGADPGSFSRPEHNWAFALAPVAFLSQSGFASKEPKKAGVLMRPLVDEDPDGEVVKELDALLGVKKNESIHRKGLTDIFTLNEEEIIDTDSKFGTMEAWLGWGEVQNAVNKDKDARSLADEGEKSMKAFVMEDIVSEGAKISSLGTVREIMEKAGGYEKFLKVVQTSSDLEKALTGGDYNKDELVEDEWNLAGLQTIMQVCWLVTTHQAMLENSGLDNPEGTEYGRILKETFDEAIKKVG